ncbi:MAG: hypothetical protein M2R46_04994 [Verrucomicrobia subdivision 3 bacterium]|nr:hypothetical protein [Limisphaerales bacterium]
MISGFGEAATTVGLGDGADFGESEAAQDDADGPDVEIGVVKCAGHRFC